MTHGFWEGKQVLVTGGAGFIGSHLVHALVGEGAHVTATVYRGHETSERLRDLEDGISVRAVDLTSLEDCLEVCDGKNAIFSLAHLDGTVAFKRAHPAQILRQNTSITLNLLEAAGRSGAERFLLTSSAEVYPISASTPLQEADAFQDMTDRLTDGYAWSKRISELSVHTFAKEFGLKVAIARPNNVYGPGDYFDFDRSRVIPRFIRSVTDGVSEISIWGTGEAARTFLYVDDLVRGLLLLTEHYAEADPVNLSGDDEISIRELAELIVRIFDRQVRIVCEPDKPSGPLRRKPDTSKARQILGFTPTIGLEEGLRRTIEFYLRPRVAYAG